MRMSLIQEAKYTSYNQVDVIVNTYLKGSAHTKSRSF
jgi:hypothetical protein